MLLEQVARLLGHARVTVKPVIDLNQGRSVNGYEHPPDVKERGFLRTTGDVFPHAQSPDQTARRRPPQRPTTPTGHPARPATTTTPRSAARHHRAKTHLDYQVHQLDPGSTSGAPRTGSGDSSTVQAPTESSATSRCRLGLRTQLGDHPVGVVGGVDRGAGDEDVRPGFGAPLDGLERDTPIDLEPGLDAVPVHQLPGAPDLGQAEIEELLAAEARLDGHEEHQVDRGEQVIAGLIVVPGFIAMPGRSPGADRIGQAGLVRNRGLDVEGERTRPPRRRPSRSGRGPRS